MASEMSNSLNRLHQLLNQLTQAEAALAEGPRSIAVADRQISLAEQQIEAQKQSIKNSRRTADELNLKLKTKEAELARLQGQLNTASSNKEYDIIKGQIAAFQKDRESIEEAALTAMESIDSAQGKLRELETELQNRRKAAQTVKSQFDSRKPEIDATIARLVGEVAEAEKLIPGEARAAYQRLRKAHGAGALSDLDEAFCRACSGRVTNQDLVRIRTGECISCRSCGRILYVS